MDQPIKHQQRRSHHNRPDLIGEHKLGDLGQLILLFLFFTVWILDSFVFDFSVPREDYISWYINYPAAAAILVFAGYLSFFGMRIVFGTVRGEPQVLTHGVFSIVRHPIYLGCILTYLGIILTTLSVLSFLLWFIIVIYYFLISRYEERLLTDHFGKEYEEYMKKVPMLFPLKIK
jgi:protein-S-isoprenylcysteine O-methyltransferase Ste14